MLQQTQAARVAEVFPRFLSEFPTADILAAASLADVLRAWAGMGYHRRAVALHEAARILVRDRDGVLPAQPDELKALPGIGPYTSAAIASIAFGVPVATVDTNVRKVMARLEFGAERDEIAPAPVGQAAERWLDRERPGDWNQALMTLGRQVCRTQPRCHVCPLAPACRFRSAGRRGRPSVRRQPPFEGSIRQVRGAIVAALRDRSSLSVSRLVAITRADITRVVEAISGLASDGIVVASPAALAGRPKGRIRLPS